MNMKSLLHSVLRGGLVATALALLSTAPAHAAPAKAYQFTASVANTSGSYTTLDHPALNGKPKLNLIVIHRYTGAFSNHPLGLSYNTGTNKWRVRQEDGVAIAPGTAFNVLAVPGAKRLGASAFYTDDYITYFSTFAKNRPNSLILATHVINPTPASFTGPPLTDPFSTFYYNGLWSVYTDNIADMKAVAFSVADVTKLKSAGVPASTLLTTSVANISASFAAIDHPLANNNPNAVVFARHIWSNASPTYVTSEVGVYYDGTNWGVYVEAGGAMPVNAAFAVAVIPAATP